MARLCGLCWKSIFSKASCGSQDIIQNISLKAIKMKDYCFIRVKAVSQEVFFWTNSRYSKFLTPFCFLTGEAIFQKKKIEILVSEYSEQSKTSRNVIFSWRPDVCMCACVRVCPIFNVSKPDNS